MTCYIGSLKKPNKVQLDPCPTVEDIFKEIVPWLGAETGNEVFGKYGYTYGGISDGWAWSKPLSDIPEEDIWIMAALSFRYWENFYRHLHDVSEYERQLKENAEFIRKHPELAVEYGLAIQP